MTSLPFIPNQIYKRAAIHDQYGGSRQAGISVAANYPFIFIFSLQSGHQHGYKDQWENSDVFSYTGEGQIGNMQFIRGNLALSEHLFKRAGKSLEYLFTQPMLTVAAEPEPNPYVRDIPNETERKGLVTSRVGQGACRKSILFRWNYKFPGFKNTSSIGAFLIIFV